MERNGQGGHLFEEGGGEEKGRNSSFLTGVWRGKIPIPIKEKAIRWRAGAGKVGEKGQEGKELPRREPISRDR